jgi:hypothetical protein
VTYLSYNYTNKNARFLAGWLSMSNGRETPGAYWMNALAKITMAAAVAATVFVTSPVFARFGPGDYLSGNPIFPTYRGRFCFGDNCIQGVDLYGASNSRDCNQTGTGNPIRLTRRGSYYDPYRFGSLTDFGSYGGANWNKGSNFSDFSEFNQSSPGSTDWRPIDSLSLRSAYGEAFRAPTIAELFRGQSGQFSGSSSAGEGQGTGAASGVSPRLGIRWNLSDDRNFTQDYFGQNRAGSDEQRNFGGYGWFYDRFKYELPRGSFSLQRGDYLEGATKQGLNYQPGSHFFKILPPFESFGGSTWPWSSLDLSAPGADQDPIHGAFDQNGVADEIELDWEFYERRLGTDTFGLQSRSYSSYNFKTPAGGLTPQFLPFVSQQFDIGGTNWTSLTFDDYYLGNITSALADTVIVKFEINGCRMKATPTDPNFVQSGRGSWGQAEDDQWAIKRIGFTADEDSAWNQVPDGASPVVVAVVDTGLDWHHLDISHENIWRNENEIPDNGVDDDGNGYVDDLIGWDFLGSNNRPWDFDGHGTIVAGIIAATQDNGVGIAGINPHAKIMVLKAVNNFGTTRASYLAEAIVYATDNGARIINLSVGGPHRSRMEEVAINYAHEKGVLVVAASGNEGIELDDYGPGGGENVLTVGATHTDDRAAGFSNFGAKVDLVAPGVDVLSLRARYTDANYTPGSESYELGDNYVGADKRYMHVSGTSFSTPIVAATASLLMAKNPALTAAEVQDLLQQTAEDIESPGKDKYSGYGMVNAKAALGVEPGFFVTAVITGVEPVETEAGTVLHIKGTIDSDGFKRAWMQIGAGTDPGAWKYVGQKRKYAIQDGVLGVVPLTEFSGSDVWQVVINVEHRNGITKSTRYPVRIN